MIKYKVLADKINLKNGLEVLKDSVHSSDAFDNVDELVKNKIISKVDGSGKVAKGSKK